MKIEETFSLKQEEAEEQTKMAFIKEENKDIKIEETFSLKHEDTEEQTDLMALKDENQVLNEMEEKDQYEKTSSQEKAQKTETETLALADGDCPHCELVTAYGDSEDSPGILLRDCSSAPPPPTPTRKACRFARLPCLLGGRYLFSLCSSRAHRAAHRGCQERAVTGLAFSLPLFKPRKLRRSQGRLEADGRDMTVPTGTAQPSPSRLTTAEESSAGNLPAVMLVLQHAEASPSLSERSALRIQPIAIHADAWAKLPGVSKWVLNIIERGYSLQFRRRPRRYVARVETKVKTELAHLLRAEVTKLLSKGAIEPLSQVQSEGGLYSRYFLVPKKDGGLRPILDLRQLNKVLVKRQFRMLTTRQILVQIRQGDWFVSIDLKDAYFQIQIASRHRRYLRFAFEGQAYQYTVLPFGLSLAPRTFTKCMDAALAPLRMRGMRVLNYLDDWLILAQSRAVLIEHMTILLDHLEDLGLSVNWAKSSLSPSQKISFLGTELDSLSMIARLSQQRAVDIRRTANSFRCGASVPLKRFQKMLGLMASASSVLQLGLLRMRPLQFWLKARVPREAWAPGLLRLRVNQKCVTALKPWKANDWYQSGVSLGTSSRVKVVSTDASTSGWGVLLEGRPFFGQWSEREKLLHIKCWQ
ncbi:unnamed protein product [Leuciscus chuanchicus]